MDLFEQHRQALLDQEAPLAARMRPRNLDEYVGQDAIVGPGRLLRRAIQADQLSSLLFYGPPGTGKTTLAQVIANTTKAHFIAINAVLAGVKDIRGAIATAQDLRGQQGQRTILFVDEVHRFNKSQQDALLPWVENGTVILIGATTENPYFEVNKALVSRSRVFQLKPLGPDDLHNIVQQTLADRERGYGDRTIHIDDNALDHLVNVANGDARALLNALELAVETTPPATPITLAVAEESIQQRAVLYDKEGDVHFDTISAFIKSLRGSDPDAALYWLARMVYAGEDPRFIFRRMVIFAGEDVGLADPNAMVVANSCAQAFDRVGMPEGRYPLAQAALYLATCPKSNSVMGFFDALATVEKEREADVPNPLRDANRDKKEFGHGQGYLYPHAYRDHWVEQQYLPTGLQGKVFYQPSNQGYEDTIRLEVTRKREAQLAAVMEMDLPEVLTFGPPDRAQEQWLQRTMGNMGEQLRQVCDRIYATLSPQRHHVLLDLNAGLLTWEGLRQVPEGGVYACAHTPEIYRSLTAQAQTLTDLARPIFLSTPLETLPATLTTQASEIVFDGIVGRNALKAVTNRPTLLKQLANHLAASGQIVLAETIPFRTLRLYSLLPDHALSPQLFQQLQQAENSLYENNHRQWDLESIPTWFDSTGLTATVELIEIPTELPLTPQLKTRWFSPSSTYITHLANSLTAEDLQTVRQAYLRWLGNPSASPQSQSTIPWQTSIALITAKTLPKNP
ncbi:AAA family ATPase [Leptolyngbya cf. ectocarpi LEGE 11479]|uniref:AAA family ATPase n=1 Tax=Leptolyngbya cf. ectocarpi LEGE 11479 TaxID=1828722 RepID=A0A929FA72_LEPEC|nr:AAA family ATPase [Leptolyngbya ectocarpi]MBE9068242.1 AAA family ATPase [Leptolyngbya cf. ectocarpi LEGE 11479]